MVFQVFTFAAISAQAGLVQQGVPGFPQFGGVRMLTILLSGLLIGEFFAGIWMFIGCGSLQTAVNENVGWVVNLC